MTGALGGSRAALEAWRRGDAPHHAARQAFARPLPRIRAGRWLARHGAHAMIDVSDGLGADAAHLAAASGVGLALELERVPVAPAAREEAARLDVAPEQFAAESGEDYELLVALPDHFAPDDVVAFRSVTGLDLTRIGVARAGAGVKASLGGASVTLAGFDHFAPHDR